MGLLLVLLGAPALAQTDNPPPVAAVPLPMDQIRTQILRCWNIPAGVKNQINLVVPIRVHLQSDGTVASAEHSGDPNRYAADPPYRAVADSARRAVLACSPLTVPSSSYEQWKDLTFRFAPMEVMGSGGRMPNP